VQPHYETIRAAGGEVLAVTMSTPEVLKQYLERTTWPFAVVSDPQREQYRRFGLQRVPWQGYFHPRTMWEFVRLILHGWMPRAPYPHEDVHQLGGDFILSAEQRLIWAFRSTDPTSRPTPQDLLRELQ